MAVAAAAAGEAVGFGERVEKVFHATPSRREARAAQQAVDNDQELDKTRLGHLRAVLTPLYERGGEQR